MVQISNGLKGSHIGFQKGSLINLLTYFQITKYLLTYLLLTAALFMSHACEELTKSAWPHCNIFYIDGPTAAIAEKKREVSFEEWCRHKSEDISQFQYYRQLSRTWKCWC